MATYFIKLKRFFPADSEPIFVGPFDKKPHALKEIENAKGNVQYDILPPNAIPQDIMNSVVAEVLGQTDARKEGLRTPDRDNKNFNDASLRVIGNFR